MDSRRTQAGIWLVAFAVLATLAPRSVAAGEATAVGYWKTIDNDTGKTLSYVRLWEDKGKLIGKVVKQFPQPNGEKAQEICTECPGAQKGKPVLGMIFLWGFVRDKEAPRKWIDGKVLNPGDGRTYNAEVTVSEDGMTLSLYGYIRLLVKVGGTSVWKRATQEEISSI